MPCYTKLASRHEYIVYRTYQASRLSQLVCWPLHSQSGVHKIGARESTVQRHTYVYRYIQLHLRDQHMASQLTVLGKQDAVKQP